MPDSLDLFLNRELILVQGAGGSGKTRGVVELIKRGEEEDGFNIVLLDFDGGIRKAIRNVIGHIPQNLDYFLINEWPKAIEAIDHAFKTLDSRDWLVFEMMGSMWERVTEYYSEEVYGEDQADHLMAKRAEAEVAIKGGADVKERMKATAYGGYEGRTDWTIIKKQHNGKVRDRAINDGSFNVLGTTSATPLSEDEAQKWPVFASLQRRPEGEKNNYHKFDTVIHVDHDSRKGRFTWRTDLGMGRGKDRERELVKDIDCTESGFLLSYFDYFGLEL